MAVKRRAIRIGWATRDITPKGRCELAGQYYRRVATDVRDKLYVTAWAVECSRERQSVMVSLDVVGVATEVLKAVRRHVAARVRGLDPRHIIISAIHTHNAPPIKLHRSWIDPIEGLLSDAAYGEQVITGTAEAIEDAWRRRKPGYVSWALGQARVGHCRRAWYADGTAEMYGRTGRADFIGMEAGEDSGVGMVFCWDSRKRLTGVVVNVPCPSQVMEATYRVSADYMGEARRQLRERFGKRLHVLPQISAAGDQSPRDLTRDYRGAEPDFWHADGAVELGRRVSDAVISCYESARSSMRNRVRFAHTVKTPRLPVWRATAGEYRRARATLRELQSREPAGADPVGSAFKRFLAEMKANEAGDGPGPYDSKLHDYVRMRICEAVINRYRTQDATGHVPVELHMLRLGDIAFATNPFELFLDYGSRIKARSPARQTLLVQLACGCHGYLPTQRAIDRGGYGATMSSAVIGAEGGDKLVQTSVKAIASMWKR